MTIDHARYGRQIRLSEIGEAGQERLAASEVALGGTGAAREIEATYLRAAGVRVLDRAEPTSPRSKARAARAGKSDAKASASNASNGDVAAHGLAALGVRDVAAREVADGALRALVAMRAILGIGATKASDA